MLIWCDEEGWHKHRVRDGGVRSGLVMRWQDGSISEERGGGFNKWRKIELSPSRPTLSCYLSCWLSSGGRVWLWLWSQSIIGDDGRCVMDLLESVGVSNGWIDWSEQRGGPVREEERWEQETVSGGRERRCISRQSHYSAVEPIVKIKLNIDHSPHGGRGADWVMFRWSLLLCHSSSTMGWRSSVNRL